MKTLPARKNCTRCGRWLYTVTHFRAAKRVRGECVRVSSDCHQCHRLHLRKNYKPVSRLTNGELQRRREDWRLWWWEKNRRDGINEREFKNRQVDLGRDPMVPVGPFQIWLEDQIRCLGYGNVVSACSLDRREVTRYLRGEVVSVHLSIVDRCLVAFGERATDLYPA